MTLVSFQRDGVMLRGVDLGGGQPLVFQHGLGGSEAQVADNVPDVPGWRRLTLECRGQGGSAAGPKHGVSIAGFADDVLAFCDAQGVGRMVAGGISMGAAIALRLAVRQPKRVRALILARPAWLFDAAPPNMRPYAEVAVALRHEGPAARDVFLRSPTAAMLAETAPDNLASLLGFFDYPDPARTAELLSAIAADGPGVTRAEVEALRLPTLVIGHGIDHAHPLAFARNLAAAIPRARLVEIPPKAADRPAHVAAFRAAVAQFLQDLEPETDPAP